MFDSSVYGMGSGVLMGPIHEPISTTLNQLSDIGSAMNRRCWFLASGVKLGSGQNLKFKPGKCNDFATCTNIKNGVVPLPAMEPRPVLFQLLELLAYPDTQRHPSD